MHELNYNEHSANSFSFHNSKKAKGVACVLLSVIVAGMGIVFAPLIHAAFTTHIYPDKNILINRSFEPDDFSAVSSGGTITVTIDVTNNEDVVLRGFYYSDQVPNEWAVDTVAVSVNGSPIADYTYGQSSADEIYTSFTPHRWALEMPQGGGVFSPTHPIPASGGTARIVYTMIVDGGTGSAYSTEQDAWAGWLETDPTGTAVFGYQDIISPLNADFTAEPSSGLVPLTVQFTDTSTGDPTAWAWDLGDDSPISPQQHPTHTYTISGTYTVTLTITRTDPADSDTVVKPDFITVNTPPLQANFTAQPRLGLPPLTVQFTDLSVGEILTRAWDFGDGEGTILLPGTPSLPGPTHTYQALGCYTVTLTVYDAYQSHSLTQPRYIHVTDTVYSVYLPAVLRNYAP